MRHFLIILLFLLPFTGLCQTIESADSLKALINRKDDSVKVDILNQMVIHIREGDNAEALSYAKKALSLAEKLDYKKGIAGALGNIGWIYYRKGEFNTALEYTTKSLAISESLKDYDELGRGLNNLASIYVEQKDYPKALATFKQALVWGLKTKNTYTIGRSYNNIAYVFLLTNQLDSSKHNAEVGVKATKGYSAGFAWRTLGDIYDRQNKTALAELHYQKSIAVADSNNNYSLRVSTAHRLGKMYLTHNQVAKAEQVLRENERLCSKFHFRNELVNTYKLLALLYNKNADHKQSNEYYERFISLNDSLYNESSARQLAAVEDQFKSKLQQSKIDLLTKESELKDKEIKTQRLTTVAAVVVLMLFIALATVLYRNYHKTKLINEKLEQKNEAILAHDALVTRLNATKDKLFSIISHDLRGPFNSLTGLLAMNERGLLTSDEFKKYVDELSKNTFRTKELLNNLLHWSSAQLRKEESLPIDFKFKALVNSVILLYEKQTSEKKINVVNNCSDQVVHADQDMIDLVLRNILSNAIKFSPVGGTIRMHSSVDANILTCSISDEGVGIPAEQLKKMLSGEMISTRGTANEIGTGLGIHLCQDFIHRNGGRLWAESEENKGATFWFTLPLRHQKS